MRQEEFLMSFQEALTGEVSDRIIQENVNYYRRYINREMQMGRPEEEVLQALGSPRLLAKTIIESHKFAQEGQEKESAYHQGFANHNGFGTYANAEEEDNRSGHKALQIPSWLLAIVGIFVMALLIGLAFCVISYLLPVLLFFAGIMLICRVVQKVVRGY